MNHKPVVLVDLFSETGGLPLMKRHPARQRYRMVELRRVLAAVWKDQVAKLADKSGLPGRQLVERSGNEAISAAYEQTVRTRCPDVLGSPDYVLDGEVQE